MTSTSSHVATYLYDVSKYGAEFRRELGPVTDADRAEAGVVIAWARDVDVAPTNDPAAASDISA